MLVKAGLALRTACIEPKHDRQPLARLGVQSRASARLAFLHLGFDGSEEVFLVDFQCQRLTLVERFGEEANVAQAGLQ